MEIVVCLLVQPDSTLVENEAAAELVDAVKVWAHGVSMKEVVSLVHDLLLLDSPLPSPKTVIV